MKCRMAADSWLADAGGREDSKAAATRSACLRAGSSADEASESALA